MGPDFFKNLPSEIIIEILSRLPIRTIIHCKCVRKSWLHLLGTHEFAEVQFSKSVPGMVVSDMAICDWGSNSCKFFDFEDELDLEQHGLHYKPVTKFNLPFNGFIQGSANGMLLLRDIYVEPHALYIYNPVTREYIQLDCPQEFVYKYPRKVSYGFGVSEISVQYKVVRILFDYVYEETPWPRRIPNCKCHVYTLGTGSWRSIGPAIGVELSQRAIGVFLNGNLHWFGDDLHGSTWISCFDLETEVFTAFGTPIPGGSEQLACLSVLRDCLCLCDNTSEDEILIWVMLEYEQLWKLMYVITKGPDFSGDCCLEVYAIKIFEDGDILMAWQDFFLFFYSNKTKTLKRIDTPDLRELGPFDAILHNLSFVSLKSFFMENVRSF